MSNAHTIQPLVSVVMCTYNGEKFLAAQIDSILGQSWQNLELIIVDDASADGTGSLLKEYSNKDTRVKCFFNAQNLGYNKNFEKAFSLAAGDHIAISDQDDIWETDKISTMMNNWLPGSLFIYSLSGNFYDDDWDSRRPAPAVKYAVINRLYPLVFNSPVHGHACMFKKELLVHSTPFPENVYYDWWLSMHAATKGSLGCIPQTLTWHRMHSTNSSQNILSLKDREERDQKLRLQFIHAIETFLQSSPELRDEDKFLIRYTELLKKMDGKKFSSPMFFCIMQNRKKIFHYKKPKPLLFFSHLKRALRMARSGVL